MDLLSKITKNDKIVKIIVAVGIGIVILIFVSDIFGSKDAKTPINSKTDTEITAELTAILSTLEGVGKTNIMLTMESGEGSGEHSVGKVELPRVRGVIIACEGGESIIVRSAVVEAVTKGLGISSTRVYVGKMENTGQ